MGADTVDLRVGYVHHRGQILMVAFGEGVMPVVQSLMSSLVERYGKQRGERIYYAMEAEGKGPFAKGGKYRKLHEDYTKRIGQRPLAGRKKAPRPKARGRKRG